MNTESRSCGCNTECASEEPVVCTLEAREQATRATEFREVFVHLLATESIEGGFRWRFSAEPGLEEHLVDLARREHDCCRFFQFRVRTDGDHIVWETRARETARSVLEELKRLPQTLQEADVGTLKTALSASGLAFSSDAKV
jgi:hypothetical protein